MKVSVTVCNIISKLTLVSKLGSICCVHIAGAVSWRQFEPAGNRAIDTVIAYINGFTSIAFIIFLHIGYERL